MNRRTLLSSLLVTPAVAAILASCGDDSTAASPDDTSAPVDPNGLFLRLAYEGGFAPLGAGITFPPSALVSADGRWFRPGAVPAIFPGPMVNPVGVSQLTPKGFERLIEIADAAGLLAPPPDYSVGELLVADVPDTVLTLVTPQGTFVHQAPALGFGGGVDGAEESSPQRQQLLTFTNALSDLATMLGASEVGPEELFVPTELNLQAIVTDPAELAGIDPAPTTLDWPADTGLTLADATTCAVASTNAAVATLTEANSNTFFLEGDVLYRVVAGVRLPGDPAC